MSSLSLPCSRDRHGSCAGEFAFGVSRWLMHDECTCSCHAELDVLDPRYGVWGARGAPHLQLVAQP